MTNREKINAVFSDVDLVSWGELSEYHFWSSPRSAVVGLKSLCNRLVETKSLDEINKVLSRRSMGKIHEDGWWYSCSLTWHAGRRVFRVKGQSKNVATNVRALARKVKKILEQ